MRRFVPPATTFVDFAVPTPNADVESLAIGPGGRVWFVGVKAKRVGFVLP